MLVLISLSLTGCAENIILSDHCFNQRLLGIDNIDDAIVYDCLCAEEKVDKKCEK